NDAISFKGQWKGLWFCALMGGCMTMNRFNNLQDIGSNKGNSYEARNFISIQDYTGEGFQLYDSSEKINEIAAEHEDEMIDAIKAFFLNSYSIHIKIHNMVSGNDSVTVFVESRNEPSFHTFVIVPVDEKHRKVKTDSIWSPDGEVERAIKGGLYAMAFGEEFSKLDDYLEGIMEMFPVIGTPKKVIDMVKANGYMTPYYFLSPSGNDFKMLFNEYVNNPHMSKIDIQSFIYKNMPEPRN